MELQTFRDEVRKIAANRVTGKHEVMTAPQGMQVIKGKRCLTTEIHRDNEVVSIEVSEEGKGRTHFRVPMPSALFAIDGLLRWM